MASILTNHKPSTPRPKTHISTGTLPQYIDPSQPPLKKSPWRQIRAMPFISSLTLTLPSSVHSTLYPPLTSSPLLSPSQPHYSKVILTLPSILTDPFFTTYIKIGNIQLLSDGVPGVSDWVCTLHDGTLRIEMAREVYERCGLQGCVDEGNGGARKHGKDRWVVELDLRATWMVSGRKGFERVRRAAEQVLNRGRVWLFRDVGVGKEEGEDAIASFHPTVVEMVPEVRELKGVLVPEMVVKMGEVTSVPAFDEHEGYFEFIEWLDMVKLGSLQVTESDDVDSYISRYSVPDFESAKSTDVITLTWTGLLDVEWCTQLLIEIIRQSRRIEMDSWLAMTVTSHRTVAQGNVNGFTVLLQSDDEPAVVREGMDIDDDDDTGKVRPQPEGKDVCPHGLRKFMCFQFTGAVVP